MAFTDQQLAALKAPLDRKHVKDRSQAGRKLSYVEGWHAIAEANRIFGFDAWDRETIDLREVGEARQIDGKWRVAYMARVRITVRAGALGMDGRDITRDGCGYGSGIDKDLGQAHESALKEAETDAMKRALMTFGNPFGLALYDKDQANVADEPAGMSVPQMLHEIEICEGPAGVEMLKGDPTFRAGFKAASKDDRAAVMAALTKASEGAAA
ncbi:RAD52 family DNA repair protein [Methylobacterium oryzisoli]|uniref:RAD52 family DNA repair protein n=1 Tax=Methylobacterium oryzisoli TaxID=3385502 RepID=UPI003891A6C8